MCRVLQVSASGYYEWRKSDVSKRASDDERLKDLIRVLHKNSLESYGVLRIVKGLHHQGIVVNAKRIRRLMQTLGIKGKGTPKKFIKTTDSNHTNPVAENHLQRNFVVNKPNYAWVSDITYIWTQEGWLYLAVVIDLFSRMVVGWATSSRIDSDLVCLALQKAVIKRNPNPGLLLHSDRGVQYTSFNYLNLIRQYGIIQSMSRKANCWDNAVAESFFRSLKVEKIKHLQLKTRIDAHNEIFNYIENFYNSWRIHSFLLYKSPMQWELDTHLNPKLLDFRNEKFLKHVSGK